MVYGPKAVLGAIQSVRKPLRYANERPGLHTKLFAKAGGIAPTSQQVGPTPEGPSAPLCIYVYIYLGLEVLSI